VAANFNYMIPLAGSDTGGSGTLTYNVSTNNGSFFSATPSILSPGDGEKLTIGTPDGTMTFYMLAGDSQVSDTVNRIIQAVNTGLSTGYYEGSTFYFTNGTAVEGGTKATGTNTLQIDPSLQFTTPGVLAIAGTPGANDNSNDFLITAQPMVGEDGQITIIGVQLSGASVLNKIALSAPADSTTPSPTIPITSLSVTADTTDAVLLLPVDQNASGTATVTVTANDGASSASQSFTVTTAAPAAPGQITFLGTSPTNLANASFQVAGVYGGAQVNLYAQATGSPLVPIGTGTGTGTTDGTADGTADVTITGAGSLVNGTYTITATQQLLDYNMPMDAALDPPYMASAATSAADSAQITLDTTPPTATLTTPPPTILAANASGNTTTLTVTYADAASSLVPASFTTSNLTVNNGATVTAAAVGTPGANGTPVTFTITASGTSWSTSPQGIYTVQLSANQVEDAAGNYAAANASLASFTVAVGVPTASVTTPPPAINMANSSGKTTTLTVTYADTASSLVPASFATSNLTVNNGATVTAATVGTAGANGTPVTYTISASGTSWSASPQGTYTVQLNANQVEDLAGNYAAADASLASFTVDTVAPTASVTTPPPAINVANSSGNTTTLTVTYADTASSLVPTSFTASNLTVNNGATVTGATVGVATASSTPVTYTITASGTSWSTSPQGTYTVQLGANQVKDLAGNYVAANASLASFTVDAVAPTVTTVTTSLATLTQANVGTDRFAVSLTFSEPMATASAPAIAFTPGLSGTLTLDTSTSKWTDSTHYTAEYSVANAAVSSESVGIGVTGAQDPAGNTQTAYTGSSNFTVDTLDPAVVSVTPSATTLAAANAGSPFTLTVVYSEAMDTSLNPTILFPTSGKDPTAGGTLAFSSGSWTNSTTYVASYTVANQGLVMSNIDVEVENAKDSSASHTQVSSTQSALFSINMPATSTLSGIVALGSGKMGINHATVHLLENGQDVTGSPKQTGSDGSYTFTALSAGTYQIELTESPEYVDWSAAAGSGPAGTVAGTDTIDVTLGSGQSGTGYDFTAQDIQPTLISARLWLASAPPLTQAIQSMHTPPTVALSGASGTTSTATYQAGGSAVAIAPSATISSPGGSSTSLAWLTATITAPKDGASEVLAVPTTATAGTNITSSFSGGVLTLKGFADLSTYQTVLQSITYSDTASSPQTGDRSITVVANDGTASSAAATATVTVQAASNATMATDSVLSQTDNWLKF
jgi:cyclophilin family peptidyl-prolyl cis-trans isomerase